MIHLQLEADPTLGYAAQQNAVPVLRALVISNQGDTAITDLELEVVCSPGFAQGAQLRFDHLAPGETRRIAPIDLSANHTYLAELQESVKAEIRATARCGSLTLATATQPIEVLAYDQWAGTQSIPELLAAFCMPNNPAVDRLIRQASEALRAIDPSLRIDGYQSKSRDLVWKQVSAIYNAVCAQSLHYAEPPASFGTDGQKIRTPDRILEGRVATCLDLSMLFASCLEQAGLCPVVLLKQGHAWVGVWLHQTSFADPLTDDVQAIRKRVAAGEFLSFETTGVADHPVYRPSLRQALDLGAKNLTDDAAFVCAIDIKRAREVQIKPLPSRGPARPQGPANPHDAQPSNQPHAQPDPDLPLSIEPTLALPELDPALLLPLEASALNTPAGRLSRWKSKLLDLTLRNKLLNFRPNKSNLQMVVPDLGRLEDALSEGAEFSIRPLPALMEGTDPRMAEVHTQREGRAPLESLALEALARNELLTRVAAADLNGVLLTLHSAAQ